MPRTQHDGDSSSSDDDEVAIGASGAAHIGSHPIPSPLRTTGSVAFPTEKIPSPLQTNGIDASTLEKEPMRTGTLGPAASRFRAIAMKVVHMHRASTLISTKRAPGAEPGIDPRRESATAVYGNIQEECTIEVIDYSSVRATFKTLNNQGFIQWLARPQHVREPWVKVRWIHVSGISWDILSVLALETGMHPLALEDVLHSRETSRSKTSYYLQHLFLRVLCHSLRVKEDAEPTMTDQPRSTSPVEVDDDDEGVQKPLPFYKRRSSRLRTMRDLEAPEVTAPPQWQGPSASIDRQTRAAQIAVIKGDDSRVNVDLTNLFIFLWRDGTVVSIYQKPRAKFADPISARLRARDTILRTSADASLLVQSILDLVVDQALDVVDEYHDSISKLEAAILIKPKVGIVRALHIMSGDLSLRKRSLDPIKTLIYGLRRYDRDRCVALANSSTDGKVDDDTVQGFMSHKAKIYLADVNDHVDYILNSMDLFTSICENLISYTFNMSGYLTNETMRILTLVTIIFLPLTLLTGYFGMNFMPFPAVNNNSDILFWEIALPVMLVIIPLFLWDDIARLVHYMRKRKLLKGIALKAAAAGGRPRL